MASSKKPAQGSGLQQPSTAQQSSPGQNQTVAAAGNTQPATQDVNSSSVACVIAGLLNIGIKADASTIIDFGAIDSDDLCVAMAHTIESCMASKGWIVKPLSADLKLLRQQQRRAPVSQLAHDIAANSVPASSIGGGGQ